MKKMMLILATAMISCSALMAQQQPSTTTNNIAEKEDFSFNETTHDFGKIPQGKPVTFTFMMKNISGSPVHLTTVQAGCGCTTPKWKSGVYNPNEETAIEVGYNAANVGAFNKTVTIIYDDNKMKTIYIKGEVVKD